MFPRFSRRLGVLATASLLLVSACGDSPEGEDAVATTTSVASAEPVTAETVTAETLPAEPGSVSPPPVVDDALPKPAVEIPEVLPTELVITDLLDGTGRAAVAGDVVTVHYVGVRSADGTEFDNSYDRGSPFPVNLGTGAVIQGWDEGLVGVKVGGRRQLDIPAAMAYGDSPSGDIIQPGDALTFVIDVVSIEDGPEPLPATVAADVPTVTIAGRANIAELLTEDLIEGTGDTLEAGSAAAVHIVSFRADTGEEIDSTWASPTAIEIDPAQTLPGLGEGMLGMKVGGRRQMTIPFAQAFGDAGNDQMGLPASTDLIIVIDLIGLR